MSEFEASLQWGRKGEMAIGRWLIRCGLHVLPVYNIESDDKKGPRLLGRRNYVTPDILAWKTNGGLWFEAKRKTAFAWYRKGQCWTTGINLHHYEQYKEVEKITQMPVWLLFLQMGGKAKDSPVSPSGLYGNRLAYLIKHENHRWEKGNMVYWGIDDLKKLAELSDVLQPQKQP